jgi:hypothetical protein
MSKPMGSVLPLVGIAALMVIGFVVLMTALTYEAPIKSDRPRDRTLARERRRLQRKQLRRQSHRASSAGLGGVRALALTLRTWAIALAREWWPGLRHHARRSRARWLSLESTTGQVIAAVLASVAAGFLIAAFA